MRSIYHDNILSLAEGGSPPDTSNAPLSIDEAFDVLADAHAPWTWEKRVNYGLMRSIKPSRNVAVVCTARNEGVNILEWVAHCRAVGFEKIFLYTNDNTDGSDLLLAALHAGGVLRLIRSTCGAGVGPQAKAYEHSLHLLRELREFEWVAYLDADEFIIPAEHFDYNVGALVRGVNERYPCSKPKAVCLNWLTFGSQGYVERQRGLLQDTFFISSPHDHVKSIVRLQDVITMWAIHIPDPNRGWCVNDLFEPIVMASVTTHPTYHHGRVNHYFHKSFEEHALKMLRNKTGGEHFAYKRLQSFFEWDLQPGAHANHETPVRLIERVRKELSALLQIDGVREGVVEVEKTYPSLVQEALDGGVREVHERMLAMHLEQ